MITFAWNTWMRVLATMFATDVLFATEKEHYYNDVLRAFSNEDDEDDQWGSEGYPDYMSSDWDDYDGEEDDDEEESEEEEEGEEYGF